MINLKIAMEHDHEFRGDEDEGLAVIEYPIDAIRTAELAMADGFNFEINPLVTAMEAQRPYSRRHRQAALESVMEDQGFWALLLVAIGIALVAVGKMLDWFAGSGKSAGGAGGGFTISSPVLRVETKMIRIGGRLTDNSKGFHLLLGGDADHNVRDRIRKDKLFGRVQGRLFEDFNGLKNEFAYPNGQLMKALDKAISASQGKFHGNRVIRDAIITKLSHTWVDTFDKIESAGWRSAGYDWSKVAAGAQEVLDQQSALDNVESVSEFLTLRETLLSKSVKFSDEEATKWLGMLFDETKPEVLERMQGVVDKFKEALEACQTLRKQVEDSQKELDAGFAKHPIDIKDLSKSTASTEKNLAGISEADVEGWENRTREQYKEATSLTKQAFQVTLNGMRKELNFISAVIHLFNQQIDLYSNAAAAMLELAKAAKSSLKTSGDDIPQELEDAITAFSKKDSK